MLNTKITGEKVRVFRNQHENKDGRYYTYSTGMSRKIGDDWEGCSIEVDFPRDTVPPYWATQNGYEYVDINITDGFLGFRNYVAKDGKKRTKFGVVVMNYTFV